MIIRFHNIRSLKSYQYASAQLISVSLHTINQQDQVGISLSAFITNSNKSYEFIWYARMYNDKHPQYKRCCRQQQSRVINETRRNKCCAPPLTMYKMYVDENKGNHPHTHLNHKPRALTTSYIPTYSTIIQYLLVPYHTLITGLWCVLNNHTQIHKLIIKPFNIIFI